MTSLDPSGLRRHYSAGSLDATDLAGTWSEQFARWFAEAQAGEPEPNAAVLATVGPDGQPSVRTVLIKGVEADGLTFFTNYTSRKSTELAANPRAALCLPWLHLERQVTVHGVAHRLPREATEAYFAQRPRGSQLGAWVSHQSRPVAGRADLVAAQEALTRRFGDGPVPVPPFWGGWRVEPDTVEFWQGRGDRLHDRLRYRRVGRSPQGRSGPAPTWVVERLAP